MPWLVSNDDDVNSRSIPSSILLQASPDPIKLLAQKLFTEEHVRLENQQSGGRKSCGRDASFFRLTDQLAAAYGLGNNI
jgi:hypothetical protein